MAVAVAVAVAVTMTGTVTVAAGRCDVCVHCCLALVHPRHPPAVDASELPTASGARNVGILAAEFYVPQVSVMTVSYAACASPHHMPLMRHAPHVVATHCATILHRFLRPPSPSPSRVQRFVAQTDLEQYDGVSAGKYTVGLGQQGMAFVDDREDINSICLNAVNNLLRKYDIPQDTVGRLEVGTESLVDKSKSSKTTLMQLFPGVRDMEGATCINACYVRVDVVFAAVLVVVQRV